jgi:VanZ family protein
MLRMPRPAALLLLALLVAAVLVTPLPSRLYWQRVLQDTGHGLVFAAIAVVLLSLVNRGAPASAPSRNDCVSAFGVAVALGIATELLQHFLPGRSVSALDLLHDAAGAALGLAVVSATERPSRAGVAVIVAIVALLILAWEPVRCARAYVQRSAAFPTLAPMGSIADENFAAARDATLAREVVPAPWHDRASRSHCDSVTSGARPARIDRSVARLAGHAVLALDLTNPAAEPARFILRVLDARHDWSHEDRLNLPVTVPPARGRRCGCRWRRSPRRPRGARWTSPTSPTSCSSPRSRSRARRSTFRASGSKNRRVEGSRPRSAARATPATKSAVVVSGTCRAGRRDRSVESAIVCRISTSCQTQAALWQMSG